MKLVICHLYPSRMNIYGDRGNVMVLARRCEWRGIEPEVRSVEIGIDQDFAGVDVFFFGGGQDAEQVAVSADLQGEKGRDLVEAVENGAALLAICGGYQLLGRYFHTSEGETLPGASLFKVHTEGGPRRMTGDVIVDMGLRSASGRLIKLVGFENHSGRTFLEEGAKPLGKVVVGCGNNGLDGTEGVRHLNAFGCYLHGPVLPKNPDFADLLILAGLQRRYGTTASLSDLDSELEYTAHRSVISHIRKRGRITTAIKH